jgi:excisionase family DNA binding protein
VTTGDRHDRALPTPKGEDAPEEALDLRGRLALRPAEAARALGICDRTLRNLLHRIPHLRLGGVLLFPVDPLKRWLEEEASVQPRRVEEIVAEGLRAVRPELG